MQRQMPRCRIGIFAYAKTRQLPGCTKPARYTVPPMEASLDSTKPNSECMFPDKLCGSWRYRNR